MHFTFVRDEDGFAEMGGIWNDLLSRSATDVPFLRYEYLRTWWSTRGGGEWPEGDLWIGVARGEDGEVSGLAPLFATRTRDGHRGLMLMGSIEISDYLDLIVPADAAPSFAESLAAALETNGPDGWQVLDLFNIPESSPSLESLRTAAQRRGWGVTQERLQPCPVAVLPQSWEVYLEGLEKKQRHELRRKIRRLETQPDRVTWRIVEEREDLAAAVESFMRLMALDPKKAQFLTPAMRTQFHESARAARAHGWLQLALMEVAGVPVAGYLNFDYGNRIWVYNSGLNPDYPWLSPGWVLLAYLVRWAIEHGRQEFDFLRGEEAYKRRLGGVDRWIHRLTITRPGAT